MRFCPTRLLSRISFCLEARIGLEADDHFSTIRRFLSCPLRISNPNRNSRGETDTEEANTFFLCSS